MKQVSTNSSLQPSAVLPPAATPYWRLESLVTALFCMALLLVAQRIWPQVTTMIPLLLGLGLVIVVLDLAWLIPRRVRFYRYAVTTDAVTVRKGTVFFREIYIPMDKILSTEVVGGPFLTIWGLEKIKLGTLGEAHRLGPLRTLDARALQSAFAEAKNGGPNDETA